jgi:hypothetical protein
MTLLSPPGSTTGFSNIEKLGSFRQATVPNHAGRGSALRRISRRLVSIFAVVLLIFAISTTVAARTASADEITWPHNGCTSPFGNAPSGVDFTNACDYHDGCYYNHSMDKFSCDWVFYSSMRDACGWNAYCQAWAVAYYYGVTEFGWPFYLCRCDPFINPYYHP